MSNQNIRDLLLSAPPGQIDQSLKNIIAEFDDEPSATQLLKALDHAVHYASTSQFTTSVLTALFERKSSTEKEEATKFANQNWRKQ